MLGTTQRAKPEGEFTHLPADLNELSADEMGSMLGNYNAWREFVESQLIMTRAALQSEEHNYNTKRASLIILAKGKSVKEKEASADSDPVVSGLKGELLQTQILYEMLKDKHSSILHSFEVLSREITRRRNNV
ncbi:hypothetical protein [Flammeovirga agarivorans]|uniref:Uncharacterized protein n=1 Tax=Flammeovirga agarivorans TaxID=2726742 RepID=A0A7X8SR70_9BACT|nr:hypothetical protein [Flammeovirga agarivorans]NLR94919.1 hypothetical protein [Flammeovirga agarivorans]